MTVVKSIMREEIKKIGFDLPIEPSLIGMEEGLALYQLHKIGVSNEDSYIYTDLDGKILFSNNTFKYATPFQDSLAYVIMYDNKHYIIDIKTKELVEIPMINKPWKNINGFRNGNLAVLDEKSKKWGSYFYDRNENIFHKDIPPIWNALEFSRDKDIVYAGISNVQQPCTSNYDVQTKWSEITNLELTISAIKMLKDYAYDLKYYKYIIDTYKMAIAQDKIRYIREKISMFKQKEETEKILSTPYNIADYYFDEKVNDARDNSTNSMVSDDESLGNYQKKLCKIVSNN